MHMPKLYQSCAVGERRSVRRMEWSGASGCGNCVQLCQLKQKSGGVISMFCDTVMCFADLVSSLSLSLSCPMPKPKGDIEPDAPALLAHLHARVPKRNEK